MDEVRRRAQAVLDAPPVAPTPVPALQRRANRRRARRALVSAIAVGACAVVAVAVVADTHTSSSPRIAIGPSTTLPGPTTPTTFGAPVSKGVGSPGSFVSTRLGANGAITVDASDVQTGRVVRTLYPVPAGESVSGTAIAPNGDVWVTLNRGPKMLGHVEGGNPQPHTCSSTVIDIDPRTLQSRTVMRGNDDELIGDAQPSPVDGRVAYLHSGCATSYFDNSLQVKDLGTGNVVTIGGDLPRCHILSEPRWTGDGHNIVFAYAKASTASYDGPQGVCSEPEAGGLASVSSTRPQPGVDGTFVAPEAGCEINAVAVTKSGYAAVEHCGALQHINGPVRLLRYDTHFRLESNARPGQCENGASIAANPRTDTVVYSMYLYCAGTTDQPKTRVVVDTRTAARTILEIPGGETAVDNVSF